MTGANPEYLHPQEFIKRLAPDELGKFESVSGMMLINISAAEFQACGERYVEGASNSSDIDILRAINHEIYHFAQTIGSGYMYDRHLKLFKLISEPKWDELPLLDRSIIEKMAGETEMQRRAKHTASLVLEMDWLSKLDQRAKPGDHSLAGSLLSHFFEYQEELAKAELKANREGLSIMALVEGSAAVHAERLLNADEGVRDRIEAQLATLPSVYRILLDLTTQRCGSRAVEPILRTTALALRYTSPHEAYLPLLEILAKSPKNHALAHGRLVSENPPQIEAAGPILGAAIDIHESTKKYRVYASVL